MVSMPVFKADLHTKLPTVVAGEQCKIEFIPNLRIFNNPSNGQTTLHSIVYGQYPVVRRQGLERCLEG